MAARGTAREIVLVNRNRKRAEGMVADLQYGTVLGPPVVLRAGDDADLAGAGLVAVTAGINEKAGGATDRKDAEGRLRLLDANAEAYRDIVPRIAKAAPEAVILVVTDPPDPLADLARKLAGHDRVLSTGTFLDSLRFRFHLGRRLGVDPAAVEAQVLGEHGTSQVYLWSGARIAGVPVLDVLGERGEAAERFRRETEEAVRFANITIIEGTGASQLGIGVVTARIAEAALRDERLAIPIGSHHAPYGVTFSLPSVLGRRGVLRVLPPAMSAEEKQALERGAETLRKALARIGC
jgi:L-lactate dehydrogenase